MALKFLKLGRRLNFHNSFNQATRIFHRDYPLCSEQKQVLDGAFSRKLSLSTVFREEEEALNVKDPDKDRRELVPVETSIRYMQSSAFKEAYGDKPVWFYYRRNFKGQFPPSKTRQSCIRKGFIATGNPCPICRDRYLVLHYTNVALLKQFISEISGEILSYQLTGVCQRQYNNLLIEIQKAKDYGTITFDLPFRAFDYKEYVPKRLEFH